MVRFPALAAVLATALGAASCGGGRAQSAAPERPSILLVTLDTTRADSIGPDAKGVKTPAFDAVAARGLVFERAYAAVPETLPSHTTIMTGLYPAGHGLHENGRTLPASFPVLAERLHAAGYRTEAFVSAFVLARQFGLARGFDEYDDRMPAGREERSARETTDAAIAALQKATTMPRFVWEHNYDPHYPYAPPEPWRTQYANAPYLGEIASMDHEFGRLIDAFNASAHGHGAVVLVGDHGEGLGDHGEQRHGTLLYQSTMHVPLVVEGPGVQPGRSTAAVSTRRVFYTILDWAGAESDLSLRHNPVREEAVAGEAMKPFLEYGWQPQVMAIDGRYKAIEAGKIEAYDLAADPGETHNLGSGANLPGALRKALDDYPLPSPQVARAPDSLDADAQKRLAALGYVGSTVAPAVRKDAPRPADMTDVLPLIDRASSLFAARNYADAIPVLEQIRAKDPHNLDATLRLATSYSELGQNAKAEALYHEAAAIAPSSPDVPIYLALHYARTRDWPRAVPLLEKAIADGNGRIAVLEALASIRERQGRPADAVALLEQVYAKRQPTGAELVRLGQLAMATGNTPVAIDAFERARAANGSAFSHNLELGVLYMDARRLTDARDALDRVPPSSPDYPMALFKRAQVSVVLHEPDAAARIDAARAHEDRTTAPLIARERLFQQYPK